ncbi:unnamed protein product, partial [Ectocarpus sp. 8 AP-2014]
TPDSVGQTQPHDRITNSSGNNSSSKRHATETRSLRAHPGYTAATFALHHRSNFCTIQNWREPGQRALQFIAEEGEKGAFSTYQAVPTAPNSER